MRLPMTFRPPLIKLPDKQLCTIIDWGTRGRDRSIPALSDFDATLGDIIRCDRICQGITQLSLAQKLGVRQEKLSKLESGRQKILTHEGWAIAIALNKQMPTNHWFSDCCAMSQRQVLVELKRLNIYQFKDRKKPIALSELWVSGMAARKKCDFVLVDECLAPVDFANCWLGWCVQASFDRDIAQNLIESATNEYHKY